MEGDQRPEETGLPRRRLGRTGLLVSCIGLGGMGLISQNYRIREDACKLVHSALDEGVNFIETGRIYFDSEEIIGEVMKTRRDSCILASKSYMRTAARMWKDIEESLTALKTRKVDIYQVHHLQYRAELEQILGPKGAMEALRSARKEGLIDFVGVSSHDPEVLVEAAQTGLFDTVQFAFSPVERGFFNLMEPVARRLDIGTIVMKPLAGGNLKSVEACLRFILSHEVSTVIPGCSTVEQVLLDVSVGRSSRSVSEEEKSRIILEADNLPEQFCRRCRYCETTCPEGIPVSEIFRCEDYLILSATYARQKYHELPRRVPDCQECGACEKICPYRLPVREKLKNAHKRLSRGFAEDVIVKFLRRVRLYDVARKYYFKWIGKIPER